MKVAIVGAGWAGLAAAEHLTRADCDVTVFEAGATLGGRARRVQARDLGIGIDNGQHILLGAYRDTLALIDRVGGQGDLLRLPLQLDSLAGDLRLRAPRWPAPWHLLAALATAHGYGPADKWALARQLGYLRRQRWRTPAGQTVRDWLAEGRQSAHLVRRFWQPLCVAAMNTPLDQACAQLFANVLRDSLGGRREDTDLLIPRADLGALWPDRLAAASGEHSLNIRRAHAVRRLAGAVAPGQPRQPVQVDGQPFDAVIVTANAPATARLLRTLPATAHTDSWLARLDAFRFIPIGTLTLALSARWALNQPMLMLADDPARHWHGQWLFNHGARLPHPEGVPGREACLVSIVISDARPLLGQAADDIAALTIEQIRAQCPAAHPMPAVTGHEWILEKRATFAAVPGLHRPANTTPWSGIYVAGDWTDTGYPGVLEGAVRSGRQAAAHVLTDRPDRSAAAST